MDENGFILEEGKMRKCIFRQGRHDPQFKEYTNRENCTIVTVISAAGGIGTPLIVFKGKEQPARRQKTKNRERILVLCARE